MKNEIFEDQNHTCPTVGAKLFWTKTTEVIIEQIFKVRLCA
jgi:hypothetical protein